MRTIELGLNLVSLEEMLDTRFGGSLWTRRLRDGKLFHRPDEVILLAEVNRALGNEGGAPRSHTELFQLLQRMAGLPEYFSRPVTNEELGLSVNEVSSLRKDNTYETVFSDAGKSEAGRHWTRHCAKKHGQQAAGPLADASRILSLTLARNSLASNRSDAAAMIKDWCAITAPGKPVSKRTDATDVKNETWAVALSAGVDKKYETCFVDPKKDPRLGQHKIDADLVQRTLKNILEWTQPLTPPSRSKKDGLTEIPLAHAIGRLLISLRNHMKSSPQFIVSTEAVALAFRLATWAFTALDGAENEENDRQRKDKCESAADAAVERERLVAIESERVNARRVAMLAHAAELQAAGAAEADALRIATLAFWDSE